MERPYRYNSVNAPLSRYRRLMDLRRILCSAPSVPARCPRSQAFSIRSAASGFVPLSKRAVHAPPLRIVDVDRKFCRGSPVESPLDPKIEFDWRRLFPGAPINEPSNGGTPAIPGRSKKRCDAYAGRDISPPYFPEYELVSDRYVPASGLFSCLRNCWANMLFGSFATTLFNSANDSSLLPCSCKA
jgi:hypothetical protein